MPEPEKSAPSNDANKQLRDDIYGWLRTPLFVEDFNHPALVVDGVERISACHIPAITRDELLTLHIEAAKLFHRADAMLTSLSVSGSEASPTDQGQDELARSDQSGRSTADLRGEVRGNS